ncbi:hypothetical protein ACR2R6_05885 [Methylocaldum gracile subsp. desertum]|uniref:hypothetical protein n=1 Tax=Methylocaldum sp. GT1BW TaxID=3438964 RepID=UPI003DA1B9AD
MPERIDGNYRITRMLQAETMFTGDPDRASMDHGIQAVCEDLRLRVAIPTPSACALGALRHALPARELQRLGIGIRHDLPGVGKNLQDHLHTRVRCEIRQPLTFAPLPEEQKAAALREYEANRSGALVSNFLEARAFVKSRPEETIPGLQLFFLITLPPDYPEAGATNRHGITFTAYINRPLSRGEVTLASAIRSTGRSSTPTT